MQAVSYLEILMYLSTAFVSSKVPLLKIIAIHQQIMTFLSNTINGAGGACVVRFVGFLNIFFFPQKSLYGLAISTGRLFFVEREEEEEEREELERLKAIRAGVNNYSKKM